MTYGLEQKCVGVKPFNVIPPPPPPPLIIAFPTTIQLKKYSTGFFLKKNFL
jgi:hypothetical protein